MYGKHYQKLLKKVQATACVLSNEILPIMALPSRFLRGSSDTLALLSQVSFAEAEISNSSILVKRDVLSGSVTSTTEQQFLSFYTH